MSKVVHFIYIVPSDAVENPNWIAAYINIIADLQNFYAAQLNNGKSFSVNNPIVEVINSTHTTAYINGLADIGSHIRWVDSELSTHLIMVLGDTYVVTCHTWVRQGLTVSYSHYFSATQLIPVACYLGHNINFIGTQFSVPLQDIYENVNRSEHPALFAHEMGHALGGLPDRYNDINDPGYHSLMGVDQFLWPNDHFYAGDLNTLRTDPKSSFTANYVHSNGTPYYSYSLAMPAALQTLIQSWLTTNAKGAILTGTYKS